MEYIVFNEFIDEEIYSSSLLTEDCDDIPLLYHAGLLKKQKGREEIPKVTGFTEVKFV